MNTTDNNLLDAIAAKLSLHDLTADNYSQEGAIEVLSNCVLPTALIRVLKANEAKILELLAAYTLNPIN